MAAYLFLTDASVADVIPSLVIAGFDIKEAPLALAEDRITELAPLGAIVDAATDAVSGFTTLSALRAAPIDVPLVAVIAEAALEDHPWQEVADEVLSPSASASEIRVRLAMVRRRRGAGNEHEVRLGPVVIDATTFKASIHGRPLDLTYKEFELLRFLASQPGRVFTRETLLQEVWGYGFYGGTRTVDVHIRRLRAKLGTADEHLIETVRGVGYRAADLLI